MKRYLLIVLVLIGFSLSGQTDSISISPFGMRMSGDEVTYGFFANIYVSHSDSISMVVAGLSSTENQMEYYQSISPGSMSPAYSLIQEPFGYRLVLFTNYWKPYFLVHVYDKQGNKILERVKSMTY